MKSMTKSKLPITLNSSHIQTDDNSLSEFYFHRCSFNNRTRHSVRIIFGHYTKSIWTCKLFSVLNWHNIKRKEPQNWIVILTIFIIFLVTYNDCSYVMLLFLTCITIEFRLACIVKYFLNRSYLSFQSFHLLCYTNSYFSFSAAAAEIEVVPVPSSS